MDEHITGATADEKAFLAEKTLKNNINLRSEMAQEIISRKPDFMEKWALLIFMGILLLLLGATWFIKYPDIIEAHATLTAYNAPKQVVIRQEGRLIKLLVHNNEKVYKNEVFGWIESTASHEEVLELSGQLDSSVGLLNTGQGALVSRLLEKRFNSLGEIQQGYQTFITALQLFNDYIVNGFYARKKAMLQTDIHSLDNANQIIQNQKALTERDVKLVEETYNMNKKLYDEKVLSSEELRTEESKMLNKQMALPQLEAALLANETQKRDKLKELDQIDHDIAQQQLIFQQALQSLKSSVDDWKKRYILQSPLDGRVVFVIPLQENQFLQQGKLIGYINPDDSHVYAEAYLSQSNFGKIDTGLKVQLRFDAYPYQEVGFVGGTLSYISNIPSDSGFLANIRLDQGLVTNDKKPIPYKSGLRAEAIVITRNMRLLQRLWFNINKSTSVGSK
jgi:multidrug resistance efflux pump